MGKKELKKQIKPPFGAVASISSGRDITRGYVDAMALLPVQDSVLRMLGGAALGAYEEVLRDDTVKTALQQRFLALTATEWRVEPGGKSRMDRLAAESLQKQLEKIDFDGITEKMLYALFYGYAVAECMWGVEYDQVVLQEIKVRKQRRFAFSPDGSLRLLTGANPQGELLPDRKFWHFCCGADNDDEPYGLGLAHWLYWLVRFKRGGIRAWLSFLDKFGQPSAVGEFPLGTTEEEQKKLLQAVDGLRSQSGIIIPQGMIIRLLEATRSGQADYADLTRILNESITRLILTQNMTTSDGSSLSQAQVHERMLGSVVRADGNLIASSFNRSVSVWLSDWNFPGAVTPRLVFMTEEPEDLNRRAEREKTISETTGLRPSKKHVEEVYGGDWEEKEQSAPMVAPDPAGKDLAAEQKQQEPAFAEASPYPAQQAIDAVQLPAEQIHAAMTALLAPFISRLQEGATAQELLVQLGEIYREMNYQQLAELLDRIIMAGEVWGRLDADSA
ncbi:DUF935 domain-containing protein [Candidatus Magnetaquicoccus inordinatus]|uniref:DUF935 domain-containing protein n=1 Tax=Candidatus Magnetaquicoccus inordinatus TaxID=2496818 RepID=UPI00102BCAE7|nr:DUF935 family protein [Candidatus Magnetaquicoccus inordinatus]